MAKITPEILIWARETAGLTLAEACKKLGIKSLKVSSDIQILERIEKGEIEPSRSMLENMSIVYRRSLLIFYMEKPPRKGNRGTDFRNLPENFPKRDKYLVDALIRNIRVRQEIIKDALVEDEIAKTLDFVGCMSKENSIFEVVQSIKMTIDFNIIEFRKKASPEKAFDYLRQKVEKIGVFVLLIGDFGNHYSTFNLDAFRGFCISDDIAPFIVLNDKDAKSALSFTLLHELAHIILGQTGISGQNGEGLIEQFCNDVAGELLFPATDLVNFDFSSASNLNELSNQISFFSQKWNLSHSLIAYKLFRNGFINKKEWVSLNKTFFAFWEKSKKEKYGAKNSNYPPFTILRRYKIGKNLIGYVKRFVNQGTISTTNAAKVLGVNPRSVTSIIDYR